MKSISINQLTKHKSLKLSRSQFFWHYFFVLLSFGFSLMSFYHFIVIKITENYKGIRTENEMLSCFIVFFIISVLLFLINYRRLKFTQIDISLDETEFKNKMIEIAEIENWKIINNTKEFAVFINGSLWTWGLRMTILRSEKYLLVNSICDPDSKPCISIFNENELNIKRLKKHFLKKE
jgi:hypothetical protein